VNGPVVSNFKAKKVFIDSCRPCTFEPTLVDASGNDVRVVGIDVCSPNGSPDGNLFSAFMVEVSAHDFDSKCAVLVSFESGQWLGCAGKAAAGGEIAFWG
jgi:hypothetical protein